MTKARRKGTGSRGAPSKYQQRYCSEIILWCKSGNTFDSFAHHIGVTIVTIHNWAKEFEEFRDAKATAKAEAENVIYRIGLMGMNGKIKGFNALTHMFYLKARFGWRENEAPEDEDVGLQFNYG